MKPVTPYSVGLTYHTISCSIAARGCGRGMDRAPGDRGIAGSWFLEYQDTAGTASGQDETWEFLSSMILSSEMKYHGLCFFMRIISA